MFLNDSLTLGSGQSHVIWQYSSSASFHSFIALQKFHLCESPVKVDPHEVVGQCDPQHQHTP
jgi:hypothetical protein